MFSDLPCVLSFRKSIATGLLATWSLIVVFQSFQSTNLHSIFYIHCFTLLSACWCLPPCLRVSHWSTCSFSTLPSPANSTLLSFCVCTLHPQPTFPFILHLRTCVNFHFVLLHGCSLLALLECPSDCGSSILFLAIQFLGNIGIYSCTEHLLPGCPSDSPWSNDLPRESGLAAFLVFVCSLQLVLLFIVLLLCCLAPTWSLHLIAIQIPHPAFMMAFPLGCLFYLFV